MMFSVSVAWLPANALHQVSLTGNIDCGINFTVTYFTAAIAAIKWMQ